MSNTVPVTTRLREALLERFSVLRDEGRAREVVTHSFFGTGDLPTLLERFRDRVPLLILSPGARTPLGRERAQGLICRQDYDIRYRLAGIVADRRGDLSRIEVVELLADRCFELLQDQRFPESVQAANRFFYPPHVASDQIIDVPDFSAFVAEFLVRVRFSVREAEKEP